jgi:hypothetical protein
MSADLVIEFVAIIRDLRFGRLEPGKGCRKPEKPGGSFPSGGAWVRFAKTYYFGRGERRPETATMGVVLWRTGLNAVFHPASLWHAAWLAFAGNPAKLLILWIIFVGKFRHRKKLLKICGVNGRAWTNPRDAS